MFGYPNLDAGLNSSRFGGDIAFPKGKIGRSLPSIVKASMLRCLAKSADACQEFNSGDQTVIKPPFNSITYFGP